MSTIFGIHVAGGRSMNPDAADAMSAAMHHWTPDDTGVWRGEGVLMGHLMLRNTPESMNEHNPLTHGGCTIVSDARLDNRDELLHVLSDERDIDQSSPDSHLILRLYLKYGASCTDRLVGDFAFAVWDGRSGELFCARDHMGVKPFFYHSKGGLYVFASEPCGVLAHPDVPAEPDGEFVFRLIAGLPPMPESTFHSSMRHLLPGHLARHGEQGLTVKRFWSLQRPRRLLKGDIRELRDGFRDILSRAVGDRLRSVHPIACELSGGLDSSAVTSLAARLVDDLQRLHTFSAVLPRDGNGRKPFQDEEEFADEVIRHTGIGNVVKISSSDRKALFEAQDLELEVCAGVDIFSSFWLEPFRRDMSEKGVRTTLSGFLGDELVTNHGRDWFQEYLSEGRPLRFLKASVEARGLPATLRSLVASALPAGVRRMLGKKPTMEPSIGFLKNEPLWLDRLRSLREMDSGGAIGYKDRLIANVTNLHARQRMQSEALYGIRHRIEPRYPLADIRVIQYVLSLPAEALGKAGVERRLVRDSLKNIVPDRVLQRTDKQVAAGVFYIQEERSRADGLREWIKEQSRSPMHPLLEPLDMDRVLRALDPADPDNRWEGAFYPQLSFQIQSLLRFFRTV